MVSQYLYEYIRCVYTTHKRETSLFCPRSSFKNLRHPRRLCRPRKENKKKKKLINCQSS